MPTTYDPHHPRHHRADRAPPGNTPLQIVAQAYGIPVEQSR